MLFFRRLPLDASKKFTMFNLQVLLQEEPVVTSTTCPVATSLTLHDTLFKSPCHRAGSMRPTDGRDGRDGESAGGRAGPARVRQGRQVCVWRKEGNRAMSDTRVTRYGLH